MKNRPEFVYALLVEADPVPDPKRLLETDAPGPHLSLVPDTGETSETLEWADTGRAIAWWRHAVAAAAVALVAVFAVVLATRDTGGDVVQPATFEQEALDRVAQWFEAIDEGRIDDLSTIAGQELTGAEIQMWEFNSILASAYPRQLRECVITQSVGDLVNLDCFVTDSDPVFVAAGVSDQIHPFRLLDGILTAQEFRSEIAEASPFAGAAAYADYLARFHSAEFEAACRPTEAGDAIFNGYTVLTPACAELMVLHSESVAAWVTAGQPEDWTP